MQETPRISLLVLARCHKVSLCFNLANIFRPGLHHLNTLCLRSVSKAFGVSRRFLKIAQSIEPYNSPSSAS